MKIPSERLENIYGQCMYLGVAPSVEKGGKRIETEHFLKCDRSESYALKMLLPVKLVLTLIVRQVNSVSSLANMCSNS